MEFRLFSSGRIPSARRWFTQAFKTQSPAKSQLFAYPRIEILNSPLENFPFLSEDLFLLSKERKTVGVNIRRGGRQTTKIGVRIDFLSVST